MRKKRSGLFIVVGVACALLAVFVAHKQLSRERPPAASFEGKDILLAGRNIQFGERLVLEGHGEDANVKLVRGWPATHMPEAALTQGTDITSRAVRANDSFVKHEPILRPKVVPDEEFVPQDMSLERVGVDKEEIKSGRLRPGMTVDVLQVVNNVPCNFMRNVRVYAVGSLDPHGRPMKQDNPSPNAFLLIRKADRLAFLRGKYTSSFLLVEAADPTSGGPVLVDPSGREEAKRAEIQSLLDEGQSLMAAGDHEKAFPILQQAAERYPELTDLCTQALKEARACREKIAGKLYEKARRAVDQDQDYSLALYSLDTIDKEFADVTSVVKQAAELRQRAEAALEKRRTQARYASLLKDLQASLTEGDLPRADQLLAELKLLRDQGFQPEGEAPSIAETFADYEKKTREARQSYDIDKKVLESYLRQGNLDQAREKLKQIKAKFPRHPDVAELEASVTATVTAGP